MKDSSFQNWLAIQSMLTLAVGSTCRDVAHAASPVVADLGTIDATVNDANGNDLWFYQRLYQANLGELKLAKMALTRSRNTRIIEIARQLENEHSEIAKGLSELALRKHVKLPDEVTATQNMQNLQRLDDDQFDKAIRQQLIVDHQRIKDILDKQAQMGRDADTKAFAAKLQPGAQQRLRLAQSLPLL